jgi:hypothetical protein
LPKIKEPLVFAKYVGLNKYYKNEDTTSAIKYDVQIRGKLQAIQMRTERKQNYDDAYLQNVQGESRSAVCRVVILR